MEEQLNYVDLLALKQVSLRWVIVHLLSNTDVLAPISRFRHTERQISKIEKEWRKTIEPNIRAKVLALHLPDVLEAQLIEMARPTALQMKRWKDRLDYHFGDEAQEITLSRSSHSLCWTKAALIDYRRTAKKLVCCNDLDLELRFKLACLNCLEEDIVLLWQEFPRRRKLYFYSVVRDQKSSSRCLHFCWPQILRGKLSNLDYLWKKGDPRNLTSFNQWAFEESAGKGNRMATEYFFQKLRPAERGLSLKRTVLAVYRKIYEPTTSSDELSEVLFYLLSVMTPEQRTEMFVTAYQDFHPMQRLFRVTDFLNWPWPDIFLEDIRNFWNVIPPFCYNDVYYAMFQEFEKSDSCSKLFPDLFIQSPPDFKKLFVERCLSFARNFLHLILEYDDSEAMRAIFSNLDAADIKKLINKSQIFNFFDNNILQGKWRAVESCLKETRLPQDSGKTLKEIYMDFTLPSHSFDEGEKKKFEDFFVYLNGTVKQVVKKPKKHNLKNCYVLLQRKHVLELL